MYIENSWDLEGNLAAAVHEFPVMDNQKKTWRYWSIAALMLTLKNIIILNCLDLYFHP